MTYMHVCTNKNYVLRVINMRLARCDGDWSHIDVLVFKNKKSKCADRPNSFEELEKLLKNYDKVYDFYECESAMHGVVCYDIILEGEQNDEV